MIGKILASKVITGIAYSLIGSEFVKKALTKQNARKVVSAVGRAAVNLKRAVKQRKEELLSDNDDEGSLI